MGNVSKIPKAAMKSLFAKSMNLSQDVRLVKNSISSKMKVKNVNVFQIALSKIVKFITQIQNAKHVGITSFPPTV
jgi:hypothetical protein